MDGHRRSFPILSHEKTYGWWWVSGCLPVRLYCQHLSFSSGLQTLDLDFSLDLGLGLGIDNSPHCPHLQFVVRKFDSLSVALAVMVHVGK